MLPAAIFLKTNQHSIGDVANTTQPGSFSGTQFMLAPLGVQVHLLFFNFALLQKLNQGEFLNFTSMRSRTHYRLPGRRACQVPCYHGFLTTGPTRQVPWYHGFLTTGLIDQHASQLATMASLPLSRQIRMPVTSLPWLPYHWVCRSACQFPFQGFLTTGPADEDASYLPSLASSCVPWFLYHWAGGGGCQLPPFHGFLSLGWQMRMLITSFPWLPYHWADRGAFQLPGYHGLLNELQYSVFVGHAFRQPTWQVVDESSMIVMIVPFSIQKENSKLKTKMLIKKTFCKTRQLYF